MFAQKKVYLGYSLLSQRWQEQVILFEVECYIQAACIMKLVEKYWNFRKELKFPSSFQMILFQIIDRCYHLYLRIHYMTYLYQGIKQNPAILQYCILDSEPKYQLVSIWPKKLPWSNHLHQHKEDAWWKSSSE